MRRLSIWLIVASLTFTAGVAGTVYWLSYRTPAVQSLDPPPCVKPPEYERLSGPCSGVDLSYYQNIPAIPYCNLVRDPHAYSGQVIRVRGIFSIAKGGSGFSSPQCSGEGFLDVYTAPYYDEEKEGERFREVSGFYKPWRAQVIMLGKFEGPGVEENYSHGLRRHRFTVMALDEVKHVP